MIIVGICDSSETNIRRYQDLLERLADKHSLALRYRVFPKGQHLADFQRQFPQALEILYVNVDLRGENGIEAVKEFKLAGGDAQIIYFARSDTYVPDALDTNPLGYFLLASLPVRRFESTLQKAYGKMCAKRQQTLACKAFGLVKYILVRTIRYIRLETRMVTVFFNENETFSYYSTMEQLENQLAALLFVRIYRSYLVNLRYVAEMAKDHVRMLDGTELPIGRIFADQATQAWEALHLC
ncbi:MAG: LytTR family transcriptional regulator DNA-binding domain-containing protein [Lachnospiraceae bacterium]|jgi:DNA-binding LytR/AlgR family response regulator|nr:LytTR family transcriptional regulator DNA-binding domain-containing protein [Lachnospiraceae bacterium]